MIGPRVGLAIGPRVGPAVSLDADPIFSGGGGVNPMAGVDQDGASAKYVPANGAQWTQTMAVAGIGSGNPTDWWLCQEAAGNLASSGAGITLAANGTPLYQQAVSGWSRLGVGFTNAANQRFTAAAGIAPNPATTSVLFLWYMAITAAPGAQVVMGNVSDGATNYRVMAQVVGSTKIQNACAGVVVNGTTDATTVGIQPVVIQYDRTNSVANVYTLNDKIVGTYNASVVDGRKGIGGATSPTGQAVYGALWSGAGAEMSAAQIKTLLQTLNWSPTWS